jgi:hypothetical protein
MILNDTLISKILSYGLLLLIIVGGIFGALGIFLFAIILPTKPVVAVSGIFFLAYSMLISGPILSAKRKKNICKQSENTQWSENEIGFNLSKNGYWDIFLVIIKKSGIGILFGTIIVPIFILNLPVYISIISLIFFIFLAVFISYFNSRSNWIYISSYGIRNNNVKISWSSEITFKKSKNNMLLGEMISVCSSDNKEIVFPKSILKYSEFKNEVKKFMDLDSKLNDVGGI